MNLSREAIVATAVEIVDTYGLPDLTMRRVAAGLGVQPSALYWHFASKQELLAAIADLIVPDLPRFHPGDLTQLRLWAARLHSLLSRHRNAAELVWSVESLKPWEEGIARPVEQALLDAGLPAPTARAGAQGLAHLVLAQAFDDDQRRQAVQLNLAEPETDIDSAQTLDDAVALLVDGLRAAHPC